MKTLQTALIVALSAACLANPTFAADAQPDEAEMMAKMTELAKLNQNHKLLADLAGNWTNEIKMWMAPGAPPMVSTGTCSRQAIMDGRYFEAVYKSTMKMPGADGKIASMPFAGRSLEGYDNVKKKFVSTWADSMGTGIMMSEGTYDQATKTFTYNSEVEMFPGMKTKMRQTIKVVDQDHHVFAVYENHDGSEQKTVEISYTRAR